MLRMTMLRRSAGVGACKSSRRPWCESTDQVDCRVILIAYAARQTATGRERMPVGIGVVMLSHASALLLGIGRGDGAGHPLPPGRGTVGSAGGVRLAAQPIDITRVSTCLSL